MDESSEFISVAVPRQHVAKVYAYIARLELGTDIDSGSGNGTPPGTPNRALVERMFTESEPAHQVLMGYLANHPGEWLGTREVAEALGLPHGARSLAGSLGALGKRAAHRYGGQKPFESRWSHEDGQSMHRMSQEVSTWIKEIAS
jgi:hypothetical protein